MRLRRWHRLFGATWRDLVHGQPLTVEPEKDLSIQQQFLDVLLIRREGPLTIELPDGFDDLGDHNLITFKSIWEPMDEEALEELVSHFTTYRKIVSDDRLMARDRFRRYAVAARYPEILDPGRWLTAISEGVYTARHFTGILRVIVLGQLPMIPRNAALLRFSAEDARRDYGMLNHVPRSPDGPGLLGELFDNYRVEGMTVPYTIEQQREDHKQWAMDATTPEELMELVARKVPLEKRLDGLSPEQLAEIQRLVAEKLKSEPTAP